MAKKVALIGSGNWGSAIAKIIGNNVMENETFDNEINMWVHEEMVNGEKLTEIINTRHENVKYLPGHSLPENVIAVPDLLQAAKDADVFIFCLPHQFLPKLLASIKQAGLKENAIGVSLIKGVDFNDNGIVLISHMIEQALDMRCAVLMGANVANEVAEGQFCESTIGCSEYEDGQVLQSLFNTDMFQTAIAVDRDGVEICGALKNIVALGAGFCDGLNYGGNTKSAIIRMGFIEMKKFAHMYASNIKDDTFFESCGIADLITTCFGGRNRRCAEAFVKENLSWSNLETSLLHGQKLQGTLACQEVHAILKRDQQLSTFPLFERIYQIAFESLNPTHIFLLSSAHCETLSITEMTLSKMPNKSQLFDSILLDHELIQLFMKTNCFVYFFKSMFPTTTLKKYAPEIEAMVQVLFCYSSITKREMTTPGMKIQRIMYPKVQKYQKWAMYSTILFYYGMKKMEAMALSGEWRFQLQTSLRYKCWKLVQIVRATTSVARGLFLVYFLRYGNFKSLLDYSIGLGAVQTAVPREICYDFQDRNIMVNGISNFFNFLAVLLPWSNIKSFAQQKTQFVQEQGDKQHCVLCREKPEMPMKANCGHLYCYFCLHKVIHEKDACLICNKSVQNAKRA